MIAICSNPFRDINFEVAKQIATIVETHNKIAAICPVFATTENCELNFPVMTITDVSCDSELFIVVGGDGTILNVARETRKKQVPILGVNMGTKGFLTSLEMDELFRIHDAIDGNMFFSERMLIDIAVSSNSDLILQDSALNDCVIHGSGECIKIEAFVDGVKFMDFSGDGLIVSTPTGSTGYNLSAGGPIAAPESECIILSPICAHAMGARSFIFGADKEIIIRPKKLHDRRGYISVDGYDLADVSDSTEVIISKSMMKTSLVDFKQRSFYELTLNKLR